MITKKKKRKIRIGIVVLSITLIGIGSGGYLYYARHKEPTNGIFVFNQVREEASLIGDLYQPIQKDNHYQEETHPA